MAEETQHISQITEAFSALDDTEVGVRATARWRDFLTGKISREPIDNLNTVPEIAAAYEKRFYEIYAYLREGRSQFDKRVEEYGFVQKFHEKYLTDLTI
jgi:hypothetical protein